MATPPDQAKPTGEYTVAAPLLSCAFDAGGRFLFAGGRDRGLVIVDTSSGTQSVVPGHDSWIGSIVRAGDGLVLTSDYQGRVIAWDCRNGAPQPRWTLEAHPCTIHALSVNLARATFASADRDGLVRVWRTADGSPVGELPRLEFPAYGVALLPDGKQLVTADRQPQKPRLQIHDLASGKVLLSVDVPELSGYRRVEDIEWGGIRGLTVSPDGSQIVACGRNGYDGPACALLYETGTGRLQQKLSSDLKGGFYYGARFHPNGLLLTVGGDLGKGELRFWNADGAVSKGVITIPGPATAFDIHPDGTRFAVASNVGKGSYPDSGLITLHESPV